MTTGLIGRKLGMTRVFDEDGTAVPVTVIEAGPCRVVQVREGGVQLGFGARRASRTSKAALGHAKKAGLESAPQVLRVFTVNGEAPAPGAEVKVDIFAPGELVKVTGTTKGRGFQGVVHRYHFGGGPATHGNTRHRKPGSISPGTDPSRVIKGKRMPGHMGAERHTELGLLVVRVDAERNLLFVRGAIPGSKNGIVTVAKQGGPSRHDWGSTLRGRWRQARRQLRTARGILRRHRERAGSAPSGQGVPEQSASGYPHDQEPELRLRRQSEAVEAEGHRTRQAGLDSRPALARRRHRLRPHSPGLPDRDS